MRLPCQLDNPQPVSGRLGLDQDLLLSANGCRYVLIVPPVPSRKAGVLPDELLARLVKPLAFGGKLASGGQGAPDAFIFDPKLRACCRLSRCSNCLAFLWASPELFAVSITFRLEAQPRLGRGIVLYLEIGSLCTPDEEPELVLHVRDNGCLDRHQQVLLLSGILQHDGKGVVDVAVNTAVRPEKASHRGRAPKQVESLVKSVGSLGRRLDSKILIPYNVRSSLGGATYQVQRSCLRQRCTPFVSIQKSSPGRGSRNGCLLQGHHQARRGSRGGGECGSRCQTAGLEP